MSKHVKSPNDKEIFLSGVFLKKGIYVYFDKSEEDSFSGEAFGGKFWPWTEDLCVCNQREMSRHL